MIHLGGPSAKVGSSAKFGVVVFKASILYSLGVHQPKYVHLPSLVYSIQGIYSQFTGGPLAKVGLSAKFGVAVFKASILDSLGVHWPKYVHLPSFGVLVFKASMLYSLGGVHQPK